MRNEDELPGAGSVGKGAASEGGGNKQQQSQANGNSSSPYLKDREWKQASDSRAGNGSDDGQAQEARERRRDAKEADTHGRAARRIPLPTFRPAQAPMSTLRAGERGGRQRWRRERQRIKVDGLRAKQGQPVAAQARTGPIAPHEG